MVIEALSKLLDVTLKLNVIEANRAEIYAVIGTNQKMLILIAV